MRTVLRSLEISGGRMVLPDGVVDDAKLRIVDGVIDGVGADGEATGHWDARGLIVAPGVIDLHGDAFERQIMPRPGVHFAMDLALVDTDRQLVANGITTAFHAVTWSWEPGLRSGAAAEELAQAMSAMNGRLACDTRLHLRWETFNLDEENAAESWLVEGRAGLFAFNDHTPNMVHKSEGPVELRKVVERTGLPHEDFYKLLDRVWARRDEVPDSIARLAARARDRGLPMASHDDPSPEVRGYYHALGCTMSEFPKTEATARAARDAGGAVIMGAPNVVRGGSHLNAVSATALIDAGICDVLCTDYYYPAPVAAALRLATDGTMALNEAWALVAGGPAAAAGLDDRGAIAPGKRADLVLIDDSKDRCPRVVATVVAGKLAFAAQDLRAGC